MTTFLYVTTTLFAIVSLFMILLILIQKGRGGGLASAFGGAGGNTAFGAKTGDVLTWTTSVVFGLFLVLAITMNLIANSINKTRTTIPGAAPAAAQTLPESSTPGPATPASSTPAAVTPVPSTPSSSTPELPTPAPESPAAETSVPASPSTQP